MCVCVCVYVFSEQIVKQNKRENRWIHTEPGSPVKPVKSVLSAGKRSVIDGNLNRQLSDQNSLTWKLQSCLSLHHPLDIIKF